MFPFFIIRCEEPVPYTIYCSSDPPNHIIDICLGFDSTWTTFYITWIDLELTTKLSRAFIMTAWLSYYNTTILYYLLGEQSAATFKGRTSVTSRLLPRWYSYEDNMSNICCPSIQNQEEKKWSRAPNLIPTSKARTSISFEGFWKLWYVLYLVKIKTHLEVDYGMLLNFTIHHLTNRNPTRQHKPSQL